VSPGATQEYAIFAQRVFETNDLTASIISGLRDKTLLGWGASAKGAVMLNAIYNRAPNSNFPSGIIDQTPEKQGLLTPGVRIPVISPPEDLSDTDVIWVLSWNWLEQIRAEARLRRFNGQFLVTSPTPQLL
jgi:hypothetical protein